jgi:hypothetical protein
MNKLCCVLNPIIRCLECNLQLCDPCAEPFIRRANEEAFEKHLKGDHHLGPLYHEWGHCPEGANSFYINAIGQYLFWKKVNEQTMLRR